MVCFACICVGVASKAASTPGCASASARSVVECGMPNFFATSAVEPALPPTTETTSMPPIFATASRCLMPNAPAPARMTFMSLHLSLVLENDVSDRRIRSRHVIEPVNLLHIIIERAAHDEPHHQLDAL